MSTILIASVPVYGHVTPLLTAARGLVERGYTVRFLTGRNFEASVTATGATFVPLPIEADSVDRAAVATAAGDGRRRCVHRTSAHARGPDTAVSPAACSPHSRPLREHGWPPTCATVPRRGAASPECDTDWWAHSCGPRDCSTRPCSANSRSRWMRSSRIRCSWGRCCWPASPGISARRIIGGGVIPLTMGSRHVPPVRTGPHARARSGEPPAQCGAPVLRPANRAAATCSSA